MKITIVIPTFNEEKNIKQLLQEIWDALLPYQVMYDVIVVDDSDDNTALIAKTLGASVIEGQRKGLGQAIIDGINASNSKVVLCMDSDLSHRPHDLPKLLKPILEQGYDMVIGSRYVPCGDYSDWALNRKIKSLIGVKLMKLVTGVNDSNSGFFCFKKDLIKDVKLNPKTWKIMLEVLIKGKPLAVKEVPIKFADRTAGESKRNSTQVFKDAINLVKLTAYKWGRFINFAVVGGIGAIWYFGVLYFFTEKVHTWYGLSAIIATLVAITNNYLINHYYTFRHEKKNNRSLIKGYIKYIGNSAIGDGVDWLAMIFMTEVLGVWYMLSAFIASGFAAIIKYNIANKFIWGGKGKKSSDADYEWHAFFKGLPWQKRWKRLLARIVKEFAERPDGDAGLVLEAGCGSSPGGLLINHADYIGIDPNKEKIDYMNAKELKNVKYIHGDLDTITFTEKEYFDTILFVEVIEHLQDLSDAEWNLHRMHKLLKSGGKLIVATPNFGGFFGRAMDRLYGIFQKNAYGKEHQLKFSLESLVALCKKCGFRLVDYKIPSGADMICLFEKVG